MAVCCGIGSRRAVVVLRARSYPALFGGISASPEVTFLPPQPDLLGA